MIKYSLPGISKEQRDISEPHREPHRDLCDSLQIGCLAMLCPAEGSESEIEGAWQIEGGQQRHLKEVVCIIRPACIGGAGDRNSSAPFEDYIPKLRIRNMPGSLKVANSNKR